VEVPHMRMRVQRALRDSVRQVEEELATILRFAQQKEWVWALYTGEAWWAKAAPADCAPPSVI